MPGFVVSSQETSLTTFRSPTAEQIDAAFTAVHYDASETGGTDLGRWASPRPRIVRTAPLGGFYTSAANLWIAPNTAQVIRLLPAIKTQVRQALQAQLAALGDWSTPVVADYLPAAHGELAWWQDQAAGASATRTRDSFPTGGGRLDAVEPPTGPATTANTPTSLGGALQLTANAFTPLLWLVGIGAVVYFAGPMLLAARGSSRAR